MAERTGIAWTRSTGNPWIGCTEVSPGCDACYARVLDARHQYGGGTHWGAGVPRYERLDALAKDAMRWNKKAGVERATGEFASERDRWDGKPGFWPVFPSMCDPFDNEVPDADISAGELDDGEQSLRRWTPSIHMPREASRLKLDVVAVRIERLLAISVDDCFAEGIEPMRCPECHLAAYGLPGWGHDDLQKTPPEAYWHLWDQLNERRGYGRAKNPWVWVIEFRRVNG